MKRERLLPELLSPAGDMAALMAAIAGGADAIYVGGLKFGARAYAKNFTEEELRSAVKICHIHGVRLYVTLNTLVFDKEINEALEYARLLYEIGVDAIIVADVGVASLIRRDLPDFELHASTQMGAHNTEGVNFANALGASRVVLARECSYEDIKKITAEAKAECEVFLHGALCVCHSGQCLFSSMVGGRSGNRGECAQPCRLPYNKGKYVLSLKDLSLANHIKELIASGVSSLKIEGRMKSPEYVYEVTRIYRALLDENRDSTASENKRLSDVFSRGGFTDGYFTGKLFGNMTGVRSEEDKRNSNELKIEKVALPKIEIRGKATFKRGEKCTLSFTSCMNSRWDRDKKAEMTVMAFGDIPNEAENSPLEKEGLSARLSKMGNTPFAIGKDGIEIDLDEGINLSPSAVNALRREAAELLEMEYARSLDKILGIENEFVAKSVLSDISEPDCAKKGINTAIFFKSETALSVIAENQGTLSNLGVIFVPLTEYGDLPENMREIITGIYIPPIIMEREWEQIREMIICAEKIGAKHALVGNISHISLVSGTSLIPVADFRLNIANKYSKAVYRSFGVENVILSPELTLPQARDIGGSVITLGRIPLMITERCFTKESFGCEKCGSAYLVDRLGFKFPMLREYKHRNIIFNSSPTYMGDKGAELKSARIECTHFVFSSESSGECVKMLEAYKKGAPMSAPHRRIGKR